MDGMYCRHDSKHGNIARTGATDWCLRGEGAEAGFQLFDGHPQPGKTTTAELDPLLTGMISANLMQLGFVARHMVHSSFFGHLLGQELLIFWPYLQAIFHRIQQIAHHLPHQLLQLGIIRHCAAHLRVKLDFGFRPAGAQGHFSIHLKVLKAHPSYFLGTWKHTFDQFIHKQTTLLIQKPRKQT